MKTNKQMVFRQFILHLWWTSIVVLIFGLFYEFKHFIKGELSLNALTFRYIINQYASVWLGVCAPYLLLQIICFAFIKRFFYLTFFVTWFWVPREYQHDVKDGIFSGLWMLSVIILGVMFS